jgi:hypothetical protein
MVSYTIFGVLHLSQNFLLPALRQNFIIYYQCFTQDKRSLKKNGLILVIRREEKHIYIFLTFFNDSVFLTFIIGN